jgi:hypothetical protein
VKGCELIKIGAALLTSKLLSFFQKKILHGSVTKITKSLSHKESFVIQNHLGCVDDVASQHTQNPSSKTRCPHGDVDHTVSNIVWKASSQ